ncbi:MAG: pyridoxal phosphate-dependent aminotransferase [Candidatus Omnitrophica bacterium]|nr:pyridoxal phosphate-dependent aminotransferase [Candidatus Omnitrophota bacterium]
MEKSVVKINRRIKEVLGSTTLAITARAKELQSKGIDVVNFGAGEPDFDTPDTIKQAAIKAIEGGFTKYTPSTGTIDLRKAIAAKFKKDNNLEYTPNQIAVSCGAKHSIFNLIQVLIDEGDEVLIPTPYWVSYPEMVKIAGGTNVFIQTGWDTGFKLTPAILEKHITSKSKILFINSPSNPTGVVYSKDELQDIVRICVKHQIYMISDEIYEKLIYDTDQYTSVAALGKDAYDLTITVNGVSKAFSMTGWRIGYAAGPQEIMDYVKNFQDHSTSNPTSISQAAALAALQLPDDDIIVMRDEFKKRRELMMALVEDLPEIRYIRPDGAFYLFCDVSKIGDSDVIAKKILDEVNVAVIPGSGFGAPNFIRFSFATSEERIKEGIKRIGQWIKSQSGS